MGKPRLQLRERTFLSRAEKDAKQMRRNAQSHGSIHPLVKSKRILGWLDKAVAGGNFTIMQTRGKKKYQVTYSVRKHFKTGNWVVDVGMNELLGAGKIGKTIVGPLYSKKNGAWVEVNVRW